ncbi:unnamed protein product [Musa hybrid cultivar]
MDPTALCRGTGPATLVIDLNEVIPPADSSPTRYPLRMVQAITLFESMIKTEYLEMGGGTGSFHIAATKASAVSSLALCIYTLDDSIIYGKGQVPESDPIENLKLTTKQTQRRINSEVRFCNMQRWSKRSDAC